LHEIIKLFSIDYFAAKKMNLKKYLPWVQHKESNSIPQTDKTEHPYEKILDDYIEHQNDYALLISGEWGCGKTYFIDKFKIHREKRYKKENTIFIKVSLFGVQNINSIFDEILFEVYPILQWFVKNSALCPWVMQC